MIFSPLVCFKKKRASVELDNCYVIETNISIELSYRLRIGVDISQIPSRHEG